ncbi:hypothetical protein OIV19_18270 [Brucella sp. HL-2]|nr:hypothetical protein [Brucella sp. HL-2]MCV9909549.1 hypothetical protein [Brucella sp. HL-2]
MSNSRVHLFYATAVVLVSAIAGVSHVYVATHTSAVVSELIHPYPNPNPMPPYPAQTQTQAPAQVAQPAPTLDTLEQAYMAPAQALPASVLNDKAKVAQIFQILAKLDYVEGKTKPAAGQQFAYIFFDPRCPYCHAAHTELDDKMPIRWIPIPLLGDNPLPLVSALLTNPTSETLDKAFAGRLPSPTSADRTHSEGIFNNITAFKTFMQSLNGEGVPIILIPRPDGTVFSQVGYDAGDGSKIRAEYGA